MPNLPTQGSTKRTPEQIARLIGLAREREIRLAEQRAYGLRLYRENMAAFRVFITQAKNHPLYALLGSAWEWRYNPVRNQFTVSQGRTEVDTPNLEECLTWLRDGVIPIAEAIIDARSRKMYGHFEVRISATMTGRTPNVVHTWHAAIGDLPDPFMDLGRWRTL